MTKRGITVWVAAGLVLLLSACEKEIKGGSSEGKVALRIAVSHADFVEEGTTRGLDIKAKDEVLERVIIPVGEEEEYYLSVALKPDTERSDALRGVPSDGQLITLAAFNASTNAQVGSAAYYYSASANDLIPVTSGAPLLVDVDETYYIVAYSYNSTTVSPGTSGIDPSNDLLWGKSANKYITESDRTVDINMKHLFSRVKVNINVPIAGAYIVTIGTVKIEGGKQASLNVRTGAVTAGSAVAALDVSSPLTNSGQTSKATAYYVFYPSPTKVTISTMTIGSPSATFGPISADFTKTLLAGESYILAVEIRRVGLAHTNIYWDGSKLTFDKYPTTPSRADYQGVYFKWGSLVGIEGRANGSGSGRIYIPNVSDGTWNDTKTIATASDIFGGSSQYGSDIPYLPSAGSVNMDASGNVANYTGDICGYLTGGTWRMINGETEFGNYSSASGLTTLSGGSTGIPGILYTDASYGTVFLPAAGDINLPYLEMLGTRGWYWSKNSGHTSLFFGADDGYGAFYVKVDYNFYYYGGMPASVRCIKKWQYE
jgi:hypothetical protein